MWTQTKEPLQFVSITIWVTISSALVKDPILPCLQHLQRAYWWCPDTHTQNLLSFLKFKIFVLVRLAPFWQCARWSNNVNFGTGRLRFEATLTTPIGPDPGLLSRFCFGKPFLTNVCSENTARCADHTCGISTRYTGHISLNPWNQLQLMATGQRRKTQDIRFR